MYVCDTVAPLTTIVSLCFRNPETLAYSYSMVVELLPFALTFRCEIRKFVDSQAQSANEDTSSSPLPKHTLL